MHGNCISSFLNVVSLGYSELTVLGRGVRDGCGSYWQQRLVVGREQSAKAVIVGLKIKWGLLPDICVQEVAVFPKTCDFISQMSNSCFEL